MTTETSKTPTLREAAENLLMWVAHDTDCDTPPECYCGLSAALKTLRTALATTEGEGECACGGSTSCPRWPRCPEPTPAEPATPQETDELEGFSLLLNALEIAGGCPDPLEHDYLPKHEAVLEFVRRLREERDMWASEMERMQGWRDEWKREAEKNAEQYQDIGRELAKACDERDEAREALRAVLAAPEPDIDQRIEWVTFQVDRAALAAARALLDRGGL